MKGGAAAEEKEARVGAATVATFGIDLDVATAAPVFCFFFESRVVLLLVPLLASLFSSLVSSSGRFVRSEG